MRFRCIEDQRGTWPVRVLCATLEVSASGYYAWRGRPVSARAAANRDLLADIRRIHQQHRQRYGAPRVHAALRAEDRSVSRGRIERLMRRHGIRAATHRRAGMPTLLISSVGKRLRYGTVQWTFQKLLDHCGIAPRSATCRLRIHDLRHSFAVGTLVDGYRSGVPGSRLAILSTYLGHADPGDTYWYLSAAPELLGLAGERLERHLRGDA